MLLEANPIKVERLIEHGFNRLKTYRASRAFLIKEFAGQYFQEIAGLTGRSPINLLFTTLRAYIPNLVMNNPINKMTTDILDMKEYAYMMSVALDKLQKQLRMKKILRGWITGAVFGLSVLETGLAASDNIIELDDVDLDPGMIFTQLIDLDNCTMDPVCTNLDEAGFFGHLTRVRRNKLLEVEGLNEELIMRLPKCEDKSVNKNKRVEDLSKVSSVMDVADIEDYVEVVKVWVPDANAIIYMPDPRIVKFGEFIGVKDFYGPKTGPYNFLSLTPPVPNNPLPISPASIWYDMHKMTNRVAKKLMKQVDKQRDIFFYRPMYSDLAQDSIDSEDQDWFATDDPNAVSKQSLGGPNADNVAMLNQLQVWYNYVAGNPDQMAGMKLDAKTATGQQILQSNANVSIEDSRDIIEDETAAVSEKHAWYLDTDPLINIPMIKRDTGGKEVQLWLTPEQRRGSLSLMTCTIKHRSMQRLDPMLRRKTITEFCVNITPAVVIAAQSCMQMGIQFNLQKFITNAAEELGISDFIVDIFEDPEFQKKLSIMMQMNPGKAQTLNSGAVQQQGGFPMAKSILTPGQEFNQNAQATAGEAQQNRNNLEAF